MRYRKPGLPSARFVIELPQPRPTRYAQLGYRHDGPGLWRLYDLTGDEPSCVGPQYPSKWELLCDLQRYAEQFGATLAE